MTFTNRDILEFTNWTLFGYFLAVALLILMSKISFGYGLGDLFYFFVVCFITVVQLIISSIYSWRKNRINLTINRIFVCLFMGIAILLTYEFTLGRGSENKWNGNVFVN